MPRGRRQGHLLLVRVLREPSEVGAAVDHAHLELHDRHRLAALGPSAAARVVHGLAALSGGRLEAKLDAAPHAALVGLPELRGQLAVAHATIDLARLGQLRHLDDGRIDRVNRRRVRVCLANLLAALDEVWVIRARAQHCRREAHVRPTDPSVSVSGSSRSSNSGTGHRDGAWRSNARRWGRRSANAPALYFWYMGPV